MSATPVLAAAALVTAIVAVLVAIRTQRALRNTQDELAAAKAALEQERQATAASIAAARRSTVDEVTALLENVLAHVDTEITAKIAEALARRTS